MSKQKNTSKSLPAGLGRKRPQLNIQIERLHLDTANPRLPEEIQGKNESEVLHYLFQHFDLEEIADPMGENGYFDEEPLVVVPKDLPRVMPKAGAKESKSYIDFIKRKSTHFTVVEGNRRLATAMILRDDTLRHELKIRSWPQLSDVVHDDLAFLPGIVYPSRTEVLPYLGVRHITGNKKWDSYAKARYIVEMMQEGYLVDEIEKQVGDRTHSIRKNAIAYHMLREAREELDFDIEEAKNDFSLLLLAIGQKNIKFYLGWSKRVPETNQTKSISLEEVSLESPVPDSHLQNLHDLLSWIYGEGKKIHRVINESRDITNYLSTVVASPEAIKYLKQTRNLKEAYELTDGEEIMVQKLLKKANIKLEKALGIVHRHKTPDVISEAEKCYETSVQIVKAVKE